MTRDRLISKFIIYSLIFSLIIIAILFLLERNKKTYFNFNRTIEGNLKYVNQFKIESTNPALFYINNRVISIYDINDNRINNYYLSHKLKYINSINFNHLNNKPIINYIFRDNQFSLIGDVRNSKLYEFKNYDTIKFLKNIKFDRIINLKKDIYLISKYDHKKGKVIFSKIDVENNSEKLLTNVSLDVYYDGGFSNDGFFVRNDKYIFYVLYHMGYFIQFDDNGLEVGHHTTIDNYQVPPKFSKEGNKYFLSKKSIYINKNAFADSEFLYILSIAKSKNDPKLNFKYNIIDKYRIDNGKYISTFLVQQNVVYPIKHFQLYNKQLFVLRDKFVDIFNVYDK